MYSQIGQSTFKCQFGANVNVEDEMFSVLLTKKNLLNTLYYYIQKT